MKNISVIILAAGRGTRMKSDLPKVLHPVHNRPMLYFVLRAVKKALPKAEKILVVGYRGKDVKNAFPGFKTVTQQKLLGSGDAVKKAKKALSKLKGNAVILYGDMPLLDDGTIKELVKTHEREKAACTVLTAKLDDPSGYGRILRGAGGEIIKITEDPDASGRESRIKEVNVGCYCFNKEDLFHVLSKIKKNARKKEYYLTDSVEALTRSGKRVSFLSLRDTVEVLGINSKAELAMANESINKKALGKLMREGVTIFDVNSTFIDISVKIGKDTLIYPNTVIEKNVKIGKNCKIGPFARIRENTAIGDRVEIGNFVELVRTKISSGTKVKHMTYLGDTVVGRNVNVGAGTITANFDGKNKNKTIIGNGAFIGVGAILIAPVKVGRDATVGAGSVVTKGKNVPPAKTVVGIPARILDKKYGRTYER